MSSTSALQLRGHSLPGVATIQLVWFAVGALVAFLLPFVFSSELDLDHDLYYLIYFAGVAAFLGAYLQATHLDVKVLFLRNWRWSLALGALASAFLAFRILSAEDSTPHPNGLYFAFEIGWRGVLYGAIDALLLTAFPLAVAFSILGGKLDTFARKARYLVLTMGLVWIITATYHLGYEQFRDDGVGNPEIGNTIITLPALVSTNPLGSIVAHVAMHVTAVAHAYETDIYLPPQTFADNE